MEFAGKRIPKLRKWLNEHSVDHYVSDRWKWILMLTLILGVIPLYLYCWLCKVYDWHGPGDDRQFLDWIFRDLLGILPWFVWGCLLAGIVNKYVSLGKMRLPRSMLTAGIFASVLPICSCAAAPMAHGMMMGRQMRFRAVITFLIVVPVLSPIVFVLAVSQIGWQYLLVEIVSVFALAFAMGFIIERLAGVKENTAGKKVCYSCEGCKTATMVKHRSSALLSSWDQFTYLLKYIFLGIIIGGIIATQISDETITQLFGTHEQFLMGLPGLILIVAVAIPIFICSGEDVIILAPLLAAGLPLGHAIAFAIGGNAICLTAAPVLNATFGRKVTILLFAGFFLGSITIGMIINLIAGIF
ncbi:MAG: permease [Thermoplasmatota archaeon]